METNTGYLTIYDGGSEDADIVDNLNRTIFNTKISTSRNQIFVVLYTNGKNNASIRFNARVIKSK